MTAFHSVLSILLQYPMIVVLSDYFLTGARTICCGAGGHTTTHDEWEDR